MLYKSALKAAENDNYSAAYLRFSELGDYRDSEEMAKLMKDKSAQKAAENGDYAAAYYKFLALGDYKDSEEMAKLMKDKSE